MRCTKCGVNNVENAEYCKNCGNNLNESASKDTTKKGHQNTLKKYSIQVI